MARGAGQRRWDRGPAGLDAGALPPFLTCRDSPATPVITVKLDLTTKVATMVKSLDLPEGLVASAEGNAQTTRKRDLLVG